MINSVSSSGWWVWASSIASIAVVMARSGSLPATALASTENSRARNGPGSAVIGICRAASADSSASQSSVSAYDKMTALAMQKLQELGYSIPRDVKVCGVGHSRLSRVVSPKLTTAHLFYGRSGAEAARMLISLIEGKIPSPGQIKLPVELVKGQTTASDQEGR